MESKFCRYSKENVEIIANDLENPQIKSASEAARNQGLDTSGLIKHIKKYRSLIETGQRNKCGHKYTCKMKNEACETCYYLALYGQEKSCQTCKTNCNHACDQFTTIPDCERLEKFPYTCNRCDKKNRCYHNKFIYNADDVWSKMCKNRSESRKGCHANDQEFVRLSLLLKPLIINQHQSLPQIFLAHKAEIRWSYPTILKFIDLGLIPEIRNINLTKRVVYPKNYAKKSDEPTNFAFLTNRTYDDFISFITERPFIDVVEMDTVLSGKSDSTCLLTLLFRRSNFMLAFKLRRKDTDEVKRVFDGLKKLLGIELFKKTFQCILTDNGTEFADPRVIEFDLETGEKLCNVFYCDPGKSGQKGKIEKNHVELRKIFPKGTFFSIYSQKDINLALSHVNSEPRSILNGNCPRIIAQAFVNPIIFEANDSKIIEPDKVMLHPDLFRKK